MHLVSCPRKFFEVDIVIPTGAELVVCNTVIPTGAERSERSGGTCCFSQLNLRRTITRNDRHTVIPIPSWE